MADEKILTNAQEDESSTLVKFSKAYRFEGKDYTEVDLSGMDDLSAEDMIAADRYLTRSQGCHQCRLRCDSVDHRPNRRSGQRLCRVRPAQG